MCPVLSAQDSPYIGLGSLKARGQRALLPALRSKLANLPNVVLGKMGRSVALAKGPIVAPFCYGVFHVVAVCPQKQMIRAKTRWIVALVAHLHAWRDRAAHGLVRQTMDLILLSQVGQLPVVESWSWAKRARPFQAFIAIWNSCKHICKKLETANLVSHRCTLLWCSVFGPRGAETLRGPLNYSGAIR